VLAEIHSTSFALLVPDSATSPDEPRSGTPQTPCMEGSDRQSEKFCGLFFGKQSEGRVIVHHD
jgi:hypothetical protein